MQAADKAVVVDGKGSWVAYEGYGAASDDGARATALVEHVGSLRRHIDTLSKKRYESLPDLRTLDFVLLFVPVEAAFIEAVRADDALSLSTHERTPTTPDLFEDFA